jgi:hypothetical protein
MQRLLIDTTELHATFQTLLLTIQLSPWKWQDYVTRYHIPHLLNGFQPSPLNQRRTIGKSLKVT